MRVLQVSPFTAYPPTGGGQSRVHGIVAGRGDSDTVVRFTLANLGEGDGVERIDMNYREERVTSYGNSVLGALTGRLGLGQVYTGLGLRFARPARLVDLADWADLLLVEFPWYVPYASRLTDKDTPLVYSSHNFEPEFYARFSDRLLMYPVAKRVRRLERKAIETVDLVVTTTDRDAGRYRDEFDLDTPFYVAPNGLPASDVVSPPVETPTPPYTALFVGSEQPHNVAAAERIVAAATDDRLRSREVTFRIVGSVCDRLRETTVPDTVELSGFVDDIGAAYADADIGLNPTRDGGGSNVKLPEYLGHGLATITTPFGVRGYPVEAGRHCIVTESLADGLVELLDSGDQTMGALARRGHRLAAERLTWKTISSDLFEVLQTLVE